MSDCAVLSRINSSGVSKLFKAVALKTPMSSSKQSKLNKIIYNYWKIFDMIISYKLIANVN